MQKLINSLFTNLISVPAKTNVIAEGSFTDNFFLIKKGAVRAWYKNSTNKEITTHLVFEDNLFTSIESFLFGEPSLYNFETIENCELAFVTKEEFDAFLNKDESLKDEFYQNLLKRTLEHNKRLIDLLKIKPEDRYKELVAHNCQIVDRVPLNIIASYLGITSVSLSRIRSRQEEEK